MSAYRYTAIFQYISGATIGGYLNLKGGFSESVYAPSGPSVNLTLFREYCFARASLLPTGAFISGIRVQQVDPSSSSQTFTANYQGGTALGPSPQDIPQMALLLRVRSRDTNNVRSMRIAALPDSQVQFGEYRPTGLFPGAMSAYLSALSGWRFRAQDLSQPIYRVKTISAAGDMVLIDPYTATVGATVKLKRTTDSFMNVKGGKYVIDSITDTTHMHLQAWNLSACTGGVIQPFVIIYPLIAADNSSISRAVVRKIGRPLLGYRGRRSKRRA